MIRAKITTIVRDLPGQRDRLVAALEKHDLTAALGQALNGIGLEQTFQRFQAMALGYSSDAAAAVGFGVTSLFLSFYPLLVDGKRTPRGAVRRDPPPLPHASGAHHSQSRTHRGRLYARRKLITSVAFAAFTLLLLVACGVRNALALALLAGLVDVVPFVGGAFAIVPSVFTALGRSLGAAIIVAVGMVLYQQFENRVLIP